MIAQQMITEAVSGSWMRGTIRGKKMWPKGRVLRPLNDYLRSCAIWHRNKSYANRHVRVTSVHNLVRCVLD